MSTPPPERSSTKSRKSSTAPRRAGQSAARSAGRSGSRPGYRAKPLPAAASPALLVVAALMLVPAGWGLLTRLGVMGPEDPRLRESTAGTATAMLAAGGSLAVVCVAMAWWVRREQKPRP